MYKRGWHVGGEGGVGGGIYLCGRRVVFGVLCSVGKLLFTL
jgi:hypothetical protein